MACFVKEELALAGEAPAARLSWLTPINHAVLLQHLLLSCRMSPLGFS